MRFILSNAEFDLCLAGAFEQATAMLTGLAKGC